MFEEVGFSQVSTDIDWMSCAFDLALRAERANEVPVGAVLVHNGHLVGEGYNQSIGACDPSAHAEIIALRQGAVTQRNYRLIDTTLYVTLEPCLMCAGALIHARVKRLVFGAFDSRAGAVASVFHLLDQTALNHRVAWHGGVMQARCASLLTNFFKKRR